MAELVAINAKEDQLSSLHTRQGELSALIEKLKQCTLCPRMHGPAITHTPVLSRVYLCGQAPGSREAVFAKPFAWTAGKTLFRWFSSIGVEENEFRSKAYMAAVCRCFPGKGTSGGDRVPAASEIATCSAWMKEEFAVVKPGLVIPVGRLAIEVFLPGKTLCRAVGQLFSTEVFGCPVDVVPLPHPSGASSWFKKEPGSSLLADALEQLNNHAIWQQTFKTGTWHPL